MDEIINEPRNKALTLPRKITENIKLGGRLIWLNSGVFPKIPANELRKNKGMVK